MEESQRVGEKTPNLTLEDSGPVKDQEVIKDRGLGHLGDDIHQSAACGNIEHQIRDALVPVLETETLKASAQVLQYGHSLCCVALILSAIAENVHIRIMNFIEEK